MVAQLTAASLVSENKVLAHPASVDSIPTSANQEDHVSMGTIGAVKAREILNNVLYVLAIELLIACQALDDRDHLSSPVIEKVKKEIPDHVEILAASKTRTIEEIRAAYAGGLRFFGHNYVQEAAAMIPQANIDAKWHMIGHLQRNKARQAVKLFDLVESLDSLRLAKELEKRCAEAGKEMPVLIEVNSGLEESKTGLNPGDVGMLVEWLSGQTYLRLTGLMTMGRLTGDPELSRPYYRETRRLYEEILQQNLPNTDLKILSMGMSNSYKVAIEEGANLIRLGTLIFGPRDG